MILHRFMGELEYERLMAGETLENRTVHRDMGRASDAIGFCFFSEEPDKAVHWLRGACCTDVLVTFDVPSGYMREYKAMYSNPDLDLIEDLNPENRVERTDYCCKAYNCHVLKVLSATTTYRLDGSLRLFAALLCSSYHYQDVKD